MEALIDFVMDGSVVLDVPVMIRLVIMLSLIEMLSAIVTSFVKGVKK